MHSGRRRGAKAGMGVLPLCLLSMAPVPLAGRAAVFHYPRLSQFSMSPGSERPGTAR